jgi:hypothetical protein
MGSLSDVVEKEFLDHVLGVGSWTTPPNVFLALFVGDPLDTGAGGAEVGGGIGYVRKDIEFEVAGTTTVRQINNDGLVQYDAATGSWGTVSHWALYTLASGGVFLAHGTLDSSKLISTGNTPSVAIGEVNITVSTGGCSNHLANGMLDHVVNSVTFTQPAAIHVALVETTEITDALTGITIDELEMTGYSRQPMINGGTDWETAVGESPALSSNKTLINFSALTGTTETVVAMCLTDNASTGAGDILYYDNSEDQVIGDGDTVQIAIGAFDVTLD